MSTDDVDETARRELDSRDMATQDCGNNAVDILCVRCEWTAHVMVPDAPWLAFRVHRCNPIETGRSLRRLA